MNRLPAAFRWPLAALVIALVLAFSTGQAAAAVSPAVRAVPNVHLADATQYVSDPDNVLTPADKAALNAQAADLQRTNGVELAVVVLKSVGDDEARTFATDLFNYWGLGQRGRDNGLLMLLITEQPQRSIVFETGYGLEGVLPDAICYRLQQRYMIPDLRVGQYGQGLRKGVEAVTGYLRADPEQRALMTGPVQEEDLSVGSVIAFIVGFMLLAFLFRKNPAAFAFLLGAMMGGGRGGGGGGGGSWGGGGSGGGGSMSRF